MTEDRRYRERYNKGPSPRITMFDWSKGLLVLFFCISLTAVLGWAVGQESIQWMGASLTLWCAFLAMAVNLGTWIPASLAKTEKYYDLTGSITFISILTLLVFVRHESFTVREWLVTGMVLIWTVRLGTFLFKRIQRDGHDGRFDQLKTHAGRFLIPWSLQGLWVFVTGLACTTLLTSQSMSSNLLWTDVLGTGLWVTGFALEIVADAQKTAFRAAPENHGRFIQTGLWAWSRHPNYMGEILLWTGIAIVGSGVYIGHQWWAWSSPALVIWLLTSVSGIPMLEARAEQRWGEDPDYVAYKRRTPVLWLRPPVSPPGAN